MRKKGLKKGDGYESTTSQDGGDVILVDKTGYAVLTPSKDVAVLRHTWQGA